MTDQIVARPRSTSHSARTVHSLAFFISATLSPLSRAIRSISAALANGNGRVGRPAASIAAFRGRSRCSAVTTKPPPME